MTGTCPNITCNCTEKEEEKDKPEKISAIFAKEFQDKLYRTIFTKDNDDKDPPTNKSALPSTTPTPTTSYNQSNCSNDAQVRMLRIGAVCWSSLLESIMETCSVLLTSESVDKILWCDHSNETSSAVLLHGTICFSRFYKMKFGIFVEF